MKNVKTYTEFLNEDVVKIPLGEVRDGMIRLNAIQNKLYLVNFDKNLDPTEKKKFTEHIKNEYGSIITQIAHHLGDLVVTFSIYVTMNMATHLKDLINDLLTARAETNQEKESANKEEVKEPEGYLDGKTANK